MLHEEILVMSAVSGLSWER